MLTKKQSQVIDCIKTDKPKILICSGAKRSGKTFVLTYAFLGQIARYRDRGLSFILGGADLAALRRNVLDDMELIVGHELKPNKSNAISVFGNKIYIFGGRNSDSWKHVRGFTAAGAFLNEGTALHDTFVRECISRCSYPDARVFIDTNPDNPSHSIKKDYIDKDGQCLSDGRLNIRAFNFTLFDNDTLSGEYVESIIGATPSGMFTDRDIYGRWVTAEGVVYRDFDPHRHYISRVEIDKLQFARYIAGVDWGYEHYGNISVFGITNDGTMVMLSEHARQYKEIDYWVNTAQDMIGHYGNIPFFCDSARPEHIARFRREHIKAYKANKSVVSGIEQVARRYKLGTLLICEDCPRFREEINQYAWNDKTGEPIKQFDDVQDTIRYAVYSDYINHR